MEEEIDEIDMQRKAKFKRCNRRFNSQRKERRLFEKLKTSQHSGFNPYIFADENKQRVFRAKNSKAKRWFKKLSAKRIRHKECQSYSHYKKITDVYELY
jgi:hypothetical protein